MKRNSVIAVAAGALGGVLLVAAWQGSVLGVLLGVVFSPLPLAMTALGLGLTYLPVAVMGGAVAVAVLTGSFALAAVYVLFDVAPVAILARADVAMQRLARAAPAGTMPRLGGLRLGQLVVALTIAAVGVMVAGLAMFSADAGGLEAAFHARLHELLSQYGVLQGLSESMRATFEQTMARVLPSAAAWNWSLRALVSVIVGQALLARDGFARWPTPAYRTVTVPGWYLVVFWVATVAAWMMTGDAGFVVTNAATILSLPLVLQGLAVVHCAAARSGYGRIALAVFYVVALVALEPAVVLVIVLGVIEHFSHMRRRMAASGNGG